MSKEVKHTRAPWWAVFSTSLDGYEVCSIYDGAEMANTGFIADVYRNYIGSSLISREEYEANARLIAAAPELLEACKRLIQEAKLDRVAEKAGWDCWVSLAEKAIAKAEGTDK